jgi:hypothetical protein
MCCSLQPAFTTTDYGGFDMSSAAADSVYGDSAKEEFLELRKQANAGDELALAKLRALLQRHPELTARLGDLVAMTSQTLCENFGTPNDRTLPVVVAQKAELMRAELLGCSTSPIIKLCVDRIILNWIELYRLETFHGDLTKEAPAVANALTRQKTAVELRYQSAIRTLVTVRKLLEQSAPGTKQKAANDAVAEPLQVIH